MLFKFEESGNFVISMCGEVSMCGEGWQMCGYVATYGDDRWRHYGVVWWQAMIMMGSIKDGARWQHVVL